MKQSIVIAIALATATSAHADAKRKLKGELLCGTFVDNKIKTPIVGGKVGKLTDTIACALHFTDPKENGYAVHFKMVRKGKPEFHTTGRIHPDGSDKDFEIYVKPGQADDDGHVAFVACEDFDIIAYIDTPDDEYKKTIKVVQGCPKPKPIKGKLACFYQTSDGTQFWWPGNGAKKRPRIEGDLACMVTSKADELADMKGSFEIKGKGKPKLADGHPMEEGSGVDTTFDQNDFSACTNFTVIGKVIDKDGAERFSGSLDIKQNCPD
jgi:hypothetical protein